MIFKGKNFTGKEVSCHEDFAPFLQKMDNKAGELGLKLVITSSWRDTINVKGAIVTPAKISNHLVGHAIDCNILEGNILWNSTKLLKPTGKVLEFIEYCTSIGIRWGGYFKEVDVIHFDYPLNIRNQTKYLEILNK